MYLQLFKKLIEVMWIMLLPFACPVTFNKSLHASVLQFGIFLIIAINFKPNKTEKYLHTEVAKQIYSF